MNTLADPDGVGAVTSVTDHVPPSRLAMDLFVSYPREQLAFVRDLDASLARAGLRVWFDVDSLFGGERFWDEIRKAIDAATAVVFVITPESLVSKYCRHELEYAAERQKRIVPVLRADVPDGTTPDEVAGLQWVFLRPEDDEGKGLESLESAIRADWLWLRQHARLITRSTEWASSKRDPARLLRGRDLRDAEAWLGQKPPRRERAIALQCEFVAASRRSTNRRRLVMAGSFAGAAGALGIAGFLAADYSVANLNSQARAALADETSETVLSARQTSVQAVSLCRYIPTHTAECDAADLNLGIAERASQNLQASFAIFSRVIDRFANAAPANDTEWVSLAAAHWERAVTTIAIAEAARDDRERSERYTEASADMAEAQKLFGRYPEQARERPLAVTRARLLVVGGSYDRARQELESMTAFSPEKYLVLSLAYRCLGRAEIASAMLNEYLNALPGKTDSPQFKRELPFLERNSKCVALTH